MCCSRPGNGAAIDQAKEAADEICGGNNEDGLARWLAENVL